MGSKNKAKKLKREDVNEMVEDDNTSEIKSKPAKKVKKVRGHIEQLQGLQEKDPEFYEFLKENDKELLEFDVENDEDGETDIENEGIEDEGIDDMEREEMEEDDEDGKFDLKHEKTEKKSSQNVITSAMVEKWIDSVHDSEKLAGVRSLMKAFRTACHYGDDGENGEASAKLSIMSSSVFNKIMVFVMSEMDGILRNLLKFSKYGGRKETLLELMTTKPWKNYNHLLKSYLGNALHVLNQMTDTEMISFTLRRLRYSAVFLAAFPALLRKYIKVALHFWGTGGGTLPVVAFLFIRDLCVRVGSDCLDDCLKGMYKAYVLNCQFVNATKLQHIQFLGNCVTELLGVDLPASYQHAFVFIRQLAMILREALTMKTKESFRKVYEWKFIHCLELWTGAICAYNSEADFKPLAYPLTQIISGVARLVPTARYIPLRLRCVRMLNRIAASTGTFIPVSVLLLDMLDMKEFNRPPTGGIGKALDLRTVLKVSKATLKTRSFQEGCVYSVVEEVTEHLSQWSCSIAFFELSFVPAVRLRNFVKSTKVDRFRKEFRHLIRQIEANSEFTNKQRMSISFLPNDPAAASFLEDEKKAGTSPLLKYVATLRQRAQQRSDSLKESSLTVGEDSAVFGDTISDSDEDEEEDRSKKSEKGATVFSSSWLPGGQSKTKKPIEEDEEEKKTKKKKNKKKKNGNETLAFDEDVVEDFVLSSDEEDDDDIDANGDQDISDDDDEEENAKAKQKGQKRKPNSNFSKKKPKFNASKNKKRKRAN